jgi:outer membrane protein OmpA-like peptidoglycan-associated protein
MEVIMKKLLVILFVAMVASAQAGDFTKAVGSAAGDSALKALSDKLNKVQNDKGPIIFKTGSAEIDVAKCKKTLAAISDIISNYPGMKVQIQGHTDNVGNAKKNMELSQKRAEAVMKYLVDVMKTPAKRLKAKGFGDTKPIADNKTDKGKAKNRRVDFSVTKM